MVLIKIYLDYTKYFEIASPYSLLIKNELPIPKIYQIYQFHVFYKTGRGCYKNLEECTYFVYKDSENQRNLYSYKSKFKKINNLKISSHTTIKIFMNHTNNHYHLYNITISETFKDFTILKYKYFLTEMSLTKTELFYQLFKDYLICLNALEIEETKMITDLSLDVIIKKKDFLYKFKQFIDRTKTCLILF